MSDEKTSNFGQREFTQAEKERIKKLLRQRIPKELIAERRAHGNSKVQYLEGFRANQLANEIFNLGV